ncbi:hypothetical protein NDK50_10105 [Paraburkholderia bryophila]|uniref:hypothetical protein n=1 Tax=Paraburkholderia bryophila TaxID=420952 RepID=UPI00234A56D3|nr:hypothetical protein [Paraburkholderia bryophila]WCM21772.1 hypothetical protein NDK50_10105 [Paraburkholderia bryophila]
MAVVPASYEVDIKVRFNRGEFELPEPKQHELEKLAAHLDDFKSAVIYIVAHGDSQGGDAATADESRLGSLRSGVISAIFSRRAISPSEQIHTYTEPVMDTEHDRLVEVVIKGYCGSDYTTCVEHWRAGAH